MDHKEALALLSQQTTWEALALNIYEKYDLDIVASLSPVTLRQVPQWQHDRRYMYCHRL